MSLNSSSRCPAALVLAEYVCVQDTRVMHNDEACTIMRAMHDNEACLEDMRMMYDTNWLLTEQADQHRNCTTNAKANVDATCWRVPEVWYVGRCKGG